MRLLLFVFACGFFSLDGVRCAHAQSPRPGVRTDRSSQRWLPPPEGRQSTIADQVRLLELLGSQFASNAGQLSPSALPMQELSEAQLRELDKAYQVWTEQSGGRQLPDWNSIPKEWVDQAVSNPEQLKQAQRLIEQYARQRKLPLASPKPEQGARQPSGQRASQDARPGAPASPSTAGQASAASAAQDAASRRSPPQNVIPGTEQGTPPAPQTPATRARGTASSDTASSRTQAGGANPRRTEAGGTEAGGTEAGETDAGASQSQGAGADARDSEASTTASSAQTENRPNSTDRNTTGARTSGSRTGGTRTGGPAPDVNSDGTLDHSSQDAHGQRPQAPAPGSATSQSAGQTSVHNPPDAQGQAGAQGQPRAQFDAARLKALRELLEKLSAVQASQNRGGASRGDQAGTAARGQPPESQADRAALPPPQPGQGSVFRDRSQRRNDRAPLPDEAARDNSGNIQNIAPQQLSGTEDSFKVPATQSGDAAGNDTFFVPPMQEMAAATDSAQRSRQPTEAERLRSSARRAATQHSFSNGPDTGWSTKRMGDSLSEAASRLNSASHRIPKPRAVSEMDTRLSSGDSQSDIQAKLQRDIGRFGWEKTLRKIIETTFKDETPPAVSSSSQIASTKESSAGSRSSQPRPSSRRSLTVDSATAQRSVEALSNSRFKNVISEVWKAIATAPPTAAVSSSSSPAASASPKRKWEWDGKFDESGYQVQLALLAIAAVALAVWISRKRPAFLRSDRGMETRWAEATLAEGIHTRADVIRAFHRFVSHTTEPVASWWTHRYVTGRLAQSSPQLSAALSDLSSVYEQARYMPPEAELSADQISRVCKALRECAASANPPASISAV